MTGSAVTPWMSDSRRIGTSPGSTSTVSREVARNGHATGYRADHATAATQCRARRCPHPPPAPEPDMGAAVREFTDRFTRLTEDIGLPRAASRVLVALFVSDNGLTAAELTGLLRTSPASVSKAMSYLESMDLVDRDRSGRRERYAVGADMWTRAWSASARTDVAWAEADHQGARLFGLDTPAGARLDDLARILDRLTRGMIGKPTGMVRGDTRTVLAALLHVGSGLSAGKLAEALGWPGSRVRAAIDVAIDNPGLTDPLVLEQDGDTCTVTAHTARLTQAQRDALRG
ncbi:GbsR/MarR family transcriptional regulator [Actinokineospora enzanensis]|uniref:GbsR/MarR family transcriptional regulator n=1 Tax=Actinokineospora enzanensis TaxID=155975 RepID=UPI00036EF4AD|nr:hypothetical protein [Actinokineospora enzanensis]